MLYFRLSSKQQQNLLYFHLSSKQQTNQLVIFSPKFKTLKTKLTLKKQQTRKRKEKTNKKQEWNKKTNWTRLVFLTVITVTGFFPLWEKILHQPPLRKWSFQVYHHTLSSKQLPEPPRHGWLATSCKETTLEYQLLIYLLSNHIEINFKYSS